MFDRWDNTLQNGSDTEYTFMVLALCLGVLYAFVRTLSGCSLLKSGTKALAQAMADLACAHNESWFPSRIRIPISPPLAALRI